MADSVGRWDEAARTPPPGRFSMTEETAASLAQIRGLLARGDYGSIPDIPRVRPSPVSPTAPGAVE